MAAKKFSELGWQLVIGVLFLFALYSNIRLLIQNYQINQKVTLAQAEVDRLNLRGKKLSLLLSYYQSPSYQEVEARRRLGLKKPDETTVLVKGITLPEQTLSEQLDQEIQNEKPGSTAPPSNISQWWQFFFN